jgi:ribosomal protein S12
VRCGGSLQKRGICTQVKTTTFKAELGTARKIASLVRLTNGL